jgi:hypothetical protein
VLRKPYFVVVAVAALALALVACGGNDSGSPATEAPAATEEAAASTANPLDAIVAAADEDDEPGDTTSDSRPSNGGSASGYTPPAGVKVGSERASQLRIETPERKQLIAAIESIEQVNSYEFAWSLTMDISELPAPASMSGGGAVDVLGESLSMTMDFSEFLAAMAAADPSITAEDLELMQAFFGDDPVEFRVIGGATYIKWDLIGLFLGADTEWVSFPADGYDDAYDSVAGFGVDQFASPDDLVAMLEDVWAVEEVGSDTVRGVATTHYAGVIDVAILLDQLTSAEVREAERELGASISDVFGDMPVDVWIDGDGHVRRTRIVMEFSDYGSAGTIAEEFFGSIVLDYEFFNLGGAVSIAVPPIADVTEVSESSVASGFALG